MTRAEAFSEREMAMCAVARMVEDGKTYWAAGGGTPLYSVLLGKKLYASEAQYVTEDGVIGPIPMLPFEPMMAMVAGDPADQCWSVATCTVSPVARSRTSTWSPSIRSTVPIRKLQLPTNPATSALAGCS